MRMPYSKNTLIMLEALQCGILLYMQLIALKQNSLNVNIPDCLSHSVLFVSLKCTDDNTNGAMQGHIT